MADDRREVVPIASAASGKRTDETGRRSRRYASSAAREHQLSICDLIPLRGWALAIWFLVVATIAAAHGALEAMYQWAQSRHVDIELAPLRLVGSQNLADYSLCLTLLLSAAYAALVLNFRRHKINDYRGRYRVWYYVCGALFLAASVIGANLTRTLTSTLHWLTTLAGLELGPSWGLGAMLVIGLAVGGRLLVEMRASRGAIACLVSAGGLALAWVVSESPWFQPKGEEFRQMLQSLTRLLTSQLLLLTLVVYARHVFLDAQGLVSRRERKSKRRLRLWRQDKAKVAAESSTNRKTRRGSDPPQAVEAAAEATSQRKGAPVVNSPVASAAAAKDDEADDGADDGADDEPSTVKMSRSDRRRQRKDKRRHEQRAA